MHDRRINNLEVRTTRKRRWTGEDDRESAT
jgi:hypothetical protein